MSASPPVPPPPHSPSVAARLALHLWALLGWVCAPLARLHLGMRVRRGKEDPERLAERLGHAALPRPPGSLAWIHAASVGESLSMLALIERLRTERPTLSILITTATVTSARLMAKRLPPGVFHQFAPLDLPAAVDRFLAHWRPDLALWVESELWPTLLYRTCRSGAPMALVNARMSARSFRRWHKVRWLIGDLLGCFRVILAQAPEDEARFGALAATQVRCLGNLKLAAPPLPVDEAALAQVRAATAGRPLWLAASTHPGEEEQVAAIHDRLVAQLPSLLTIIVPRHPERGPQIAATLRAGGRSVALRSAGALPGPAEGVYVGDGLGEMGLWYRLASVALIGGTLVRKGGQNPLEAARLGGAVVLGPDMSNFAQIAREMVAAGGAVAVDGFDSAADAVAALLADADARGRLAAAGEAYARGRVRILDDVTTALAPLLDPVAPMVAAGGAARDHAAE